MPKNRIRILVISNMAQGGAETFLMKLFRKSIESNIYFDFISSNDKKDYYEDEIVNLGGNIYKLPKNRLRIVKRMKLISEVIDLNDYRTIISLTKTSLSSINLLPAKFKKIEKIVVRSTNTKASDKILGNIMHRIFRPLMKNISNVKIAPSTEAANHMFGSKNISKVILVNNGIDVEKYKFSSESREKIRSDLGVSNNFLIGHVGRFVKQKNHKYLIKIFNEINKLNNNVRLLLIGTGPLKRKIIEAAKSYNILEKIIFKDKIENIEEYYMAMDVLVFPSLYEGLPNVVVEAQATGLPCLISNTISKEVVLTDLVNMLSIKIKPVDWAKKIDDFNLKNREVYADILKEKGYDIEDVLNEFIEIIQ